MPRRRFFDTPEKLARFAGLVDELPPYLFVTGIEVRRGVFLPPPFGLVEMAMPQIGTSKRNGPLMTLMLGADGEWVVWTPQGYYDTSIEGDSRFLGWHINSDFRSTRPTDFVPVGTYSGTMHQPRVLDRLWRTGNLDQALGVAEVPPGTGAPATVVAEKPVPRIVFTSVERGTSLSPRGYPLGRAHPQPSPGDEHPRDRGVEGRPPQGHRRRAGARPRPAARAGGPGFRGARGPARAEAEDPTRRRGGQRERGPAARSGST